MSTAAGMGRPLANPEYVPLGSSAQACGAQAVPDGAASLKEPGRAEKIHNILRRAAELAGLVPSQTELMLKAYDESIDDEHQGLKARYLQHISPEIFSAIGRALHRELLRPSASISREELNQWAGFRLQSPTSDGVHCLRMLQAGLAIQMRFASAQARLASDAQVFKGFVLTGPRPERGC